tara:strand:+ start:346 stop:543 length:198 start_codon:yes stop_codon:yes gene_type:complete
MEQNIIELASELAHQQVLKHRDELESSIYVNESARIREYTDEAQEIFDRYYDEYMDIVRQINKEI